MRVSEGGAVPRCANLTNVRQRYADNDKVNRSTNQPVDRLTTRLA
jgi:hypothetical protein